MDYNDSQHNYVTCVDGGDIKRFYRELDKKVRRSALLTKLIPPLNIVFTVIGYIAFVFLVFYLLIFDLPFAVFKTMFVCAAGFVAVTLIRKKINRERPYIAENYDPVIYKTYTGNSMPSRHVFSCFIIAFAFFQLGIPWFIAMLIVGALLSLLRVLGGVHYISDVMAAAAAAAILGTLSFIIF